MYVEVFFEYEGWRCRLLLLLYSIILSIVDLCCGRLGGRYAFNILMNGEFFADIKAFIRLAVRSSRLFSKGSECA